VAGYQTWKQLGRQVRAGEKGIAILAPCGRRCRNDDNDRDDNDGDDNDAAAAHSEAKRGRYVIRGFRVVHVFDPLSRESPRDSFLRALGRRQRLRQVEHVADAEGGPWHCKARIGLSPPASVLLAVTIRVCQ
jgi:hypothetical protein